MGTVGVGPEDITVVLCIRAHANKPWLLERLAEQFAYYSPSPRFQVVDFGSPEPFRSHIAEVCQANGAAYHYCDDTGVFSLSKARNVGAEHASTELLYFTDVDFFCATDFFAQLARQATAAGSKIHFDRVLYVPAYHLTESATAGLPAEKTQRSAALETIAWTSHNDAFGTDVEFIVPYSNNFLIQKKYFDFCGGYNTAFRGHGSEDFELMIRVARYSGFFPVPDSIERDFYGPKQGSFFAARPYLGFRRLGDMLSFSSEVSGLKAFHLFHPTMTGGDSWRENNDWKRTTLTAELLKVKHDHALAGADYMDRRAECLCLSDTPWSHLGYFLPLRLAGYRLRLIRTQDVTAELLQELALGRRVTLAIFNPYMRSHEGFRPLFDLATELGLEIVVIERGALPGTVYYAPTVAYADSDYVRQIWKQYAPTVEDLEATRAYLQELRQGERTLEANGSFAKTFERFAWLRQTGKTVVFVPLQLNDDMAVTRFTDGHCSYEQFLEQVRSEAERHPDLVFVVKVHPLDLSEAFRTVGNVVVARRDDNVHALLESCSVTICYNSGVGLLSLIHGRPTFVIGNAFYRYGEGLACGVSDVAGAIEATRDGRGGVSKDAVARYVGWLLYEKYSTFIADDDVKTFGHRKSHGYRNIRITRFVLGNLRVNLPWLLAARKFSTRSYVHSRIGIAVTAAPKPAPLKVKISPVRGGFRRKFRKFLSSPHAFFKDSRSPALKALRHLFPA